MFKTLIRQAKAYPITFGALTIALSLYVAVQVFQIANPERATDARWKLGAVEKLVVVGEPQLTGPLDLWDGQVWRIPVSAFHHGDLLHLAMNSVVLWYLGRLLENRMGRFSYLAFFLLAAVVSILSECLLEHSAVGLSGVAYAIFGALLVLRQTDESLAEAFTDNIVKVGFVWLFVCLPLTYFEIQNVANVAHFSGLGYGWIAGRAFFGVVRSPRVTRLSFYAAHLLLLPALYFTVHPFWTGRFQWYLASREENWDRRFELWENALQRDPGLEPLWKFLAIRHAENGDRLSAWRTILQGLNYNRTYTEGVDVSRVIWNAFSTRKSQQQALEVLREIFGDEAAAWQQRLGVFPGSHGPPDVAVAMETAPKSEDDTAGPRFDGPVDFQARDLSAPQVDPDAPDSAAEGVTL